MADVGWNEGGHVKVSIDRFYIIGAYIYVHFCLCISICMLL